MSSSTRARGRVTTRVTRELEPSSMNHRVRMAAAQIEQDAPFLTMASRRVADLLVQTVARRTERSRRAAEPQPHRGRVASSAGPER